MDDSMKAANEAFVGFTTTAVRKTIELQTALFNDFVSLGKTLAELSPAKTLWTGTAGTTATKK